MGEKQEVEQKQKVGHETEETEETQRLYGIDQPETLVFGQRCLLARRLVERGVRFAGGQPGQPVLLGGDVEGGPLILVPGVAPGGGATSKL